MNPGRRAWLARLAGVPGLAGLAGLLGVPTSAGAAPEGAGTAEGETAVRRGRALIFPRDHGAHLTARIEWWYVTGWLGGDDGDAPTSTPTPTHGFQLTFFRSRVRGADGPSAPPLGRFDPRHLLFAHAAVTDLATGRHLHAQRLARWNGDPASGPDRAAIDDGHVRVGRWQLARDAASPWQASRWQARLAADSFKLAATLQAAAPPLLQGDAGFSRKGPEEHQASHYYSLPQLDTRLALELNGRPLALAGRAWLDHEWSDELMHPQAVGWDWIGINLFDGSALTAFRLRRADGSTLWAGGSLRAVPAADGAAAGASSTRAFAPNEVAFEPGRRWRSAATNAVYPVTWQVQTPAGRHQLRALLDTQELDSRASTGAVYWEGLAELLDEQGRRIGLGYLEMTGYAARLRLG